MRKIERKWRLIFFISIIVGIIGVIYTSQKKSSQQNVLEKGFLAFNFETDREYGSLYYQQLNGEKVLIADNVLGNADYLTLDDERGVVSYMGEGSTLFIGRIGEKSVAVRKDIDKELFKEQSIATELEDIQDFCIDEENEDVYI